ncbi:MAG: hypothetical protein HY089_03290, partial [Ignavibacteriales bacterium]|nr:hypothetical protein [Ignavibacteriales bacterium]
MNTSKLFKLGSLLLLVLMIFSVTAFAQQRTWYVNSSIGSDGYDGQSATVTPPTTGPKKTINRAIVESNSGDIIVVAATAITYNAASNGEPATIATGAKKLTFRSTGGTPNVGSIFQVNNTLASPNNVTIFDNGTFNFSGGFTMTQGNVTGGGNLTLGGTITMMAYAAASSNPTFDAAPAGYASSVNFVYDWAAGAPAVFTTGVELAGPGINTSLNNVNVGTSGAVALTLGGSYTMKGILTTASASTIDLGTNTLTISGANAHTLAGNVTNGTVTFTLSGAASVAGAVTLPAVTASASSAATLTLTNATTVGSVAATTKASIVVTAATTIGAASSSSDNVVVSGSGMITLTAATTVNGNVLVNSQGLAVTANNQAKVIFGAAAGITVNGNVTNSSNIVVSNTDNSANDGVIATAVGNGVIAFPDQNIAINGNVSNSFTVAGALGSTTKSSNHGYISFGSTTTTVTITGLLNVSSSTQLSGTAGTLAGHGDVYFANTTGDIRIDGGVTNSSSWVGLDAATLGGNGVVSMVARTSGKVGLSTNKVGAITNSSSAVNGRGNGDLLFGPVAGQTATGDHNLTTVTVSGSGPG